MNQDAYDSLFDAAGQQYNVDPALLKTVFGVESGFNPNTPDSPAGAQGGMQLMPQTAAALNVTNPRDMTQAVPAAAHYLRLGLDATGSPEGALAFYHGGPDEQDWGPKTQAYVMKARALYPNVSINLPKGDNMADNTNTASNQDPDTAAGMALLNGVGNPSSSTSSGSSDQPILTVNVTAKRPTDPDTAAGMALLNAVPTQPTQPSQPVSTELPTEKLAPTQQATPEQYAGNLAADAAMTPRPGRPVTTPPTPNQLMMAAPGEIMNAAKQSFNDTNIITPQATAYLDANHPLLGAAAHVLNTAAGLGAGAFRGAQETVAQTGNSVSPGLGTDLAAGMEALPAMLMSGGSLAGLRAPVKAQVGEQITNALNKAYSNDAPLSPDFKANPGNVAGSGEMPRGPTSSVDTQEVNNPDLGPDQGPRSAGAAGTPYTSMGQKTEGAAQRDFMNEVRQTAGDRAGPQNIDPTVYVPGVQRTQGAIEFSPLNTKNENALSASDPEDFGARLAELNKNNNDTLKDYHSQTTGDEVALENADLAREQIKPNFAGQTPVDAQPIVDAIDGILNGPAGKRDAVVSALNSVRSKLFDADGNLESMPDQLYGARQQLTDMLSKKGQAANPAVGLAQSQLQAVKEVIDPTIESGAPGFTKYLSDYNAASKPIDSMTALQSYLTGPGKITDANGNLQFAKFQNMVEKLANQKFAPGANPAKAITDDQWGRIFNVRNELAANAYKAKMGRAEGSPTVANLQDAARLSTGPVGNALRKGAELAGYGVVNHLVGPYLGPAGDILGDAAISSVKNALDNRRIANATTKLIAKNKAIGDQILKPDMTKFYP